MHSKTSKKELDTKSDRKNQKLSIKSTTLFINRNSVEKIMNFAYNKKQSLVKLILKFMFVTKQDKRGHKTDTKKWPLPVVHHFE